MKITRAIPMMDVEVTVYHKSEGAVHKQDFSLIDGTDVEKFINNMPGVKYLDHRIVGQYRNKATVFLNEQGRIVNYDMVLDEKAMHINAENLESEEE